MGLVDLRKHFAEYYKSKDASPRSSSMCEAKEQINERFAAYKKLMDDVQKKDKERQDPVLGPDARAKAEAELRSKAQELRSLEQDINDFKNRRQQQIDEEQRQQASGLYAEIVKVVNDKPRRGLRLVFDKSNLGMGGVPFLVYSKAGAVEDFTAKSSSSSTRTPRRRGDACRPARAVPAPAPCRSRRRRSRRRRDLEREEGTKK